MQIILDVLKSNPLLLLFIVAGIGYPLGGIKLGGISLGVTAVTFVGLAIGALDAEIRLPDFVYTLGLVLYIYNVGLSSGSMFFASFKNRGIPLILLMLGATAFAAALTILAKSLFSLDGPHATGIFTGSMLTTSGLATVLEYLSTITPIDLLDSIQSKTIVAYSISSPLAVLWVILTILAFQKIWKIDFSIEAQHVENINDAKEPLSRKTVHVTRNFNLNVQELIRKYHWNVIFGRISHKNVLDLVHGKTVFKKGDFVTIVGTASAINKAGMVLGEDTVEQLELDLSKFDRQRIFVSSHNVTGKKLKDLHLSTQFNATVTRLRRGDIEFLPHGDTYLSPGDQLAVISPHDQKEKIASFFGDSYRAVSEIDVLTFSLGLALGLLLGMVPIPLPGGVTFNLGLAGGPLIVALILGLLGRTGNLVWTLPYSASLTLRQIGLVFLLAGIGIRSGYDFFQTLFWGNGLELFLIGAAITVITASVTFWVGHKLMKVPFGILLGTQVNPAILSFSLEQTRNDLPMIGYATVYPVSLISKIIFSQLLIILLY